MKAPPQVLLTLERVGGATRVAICSPDGAPSYVEIGRYIATGERVGAIAFPPADLPALRDAIGEAKRLLCGAAEAAENARAQELAGLAKTTAPRVLVREPKRTRRARAG